MNITRSNKIPKPLTGLISLGITALGGLKAYGAAIGLHHSAEAAFSADLFALSGAERGKQSQLSAALAGKATARKALKTAVAAGRDYCFEVLNSFRSRYGQRWNVRWSDAGFTWGGLAVPNDPVPMLGDLRGHLLAHPELASEALGMTAPKCDFHIEAISTATAVANAGKTSVRIARRERRSAATSLRKRLSSLRKELEVLLPADDMRWYEFGFRRPADGRIPGKVEDLTLAAGTPGEVRVAWDAAPLALNYRVTRQVIGTDAEPVEIGLFADRETSVRGLPSGATVKVRVSARNASGESAPAEASITVP